MEGLLWHKSQKFLMMVTGGICHNTRCIVPCRVWGCIATYWSECPYQPLFPVKNAYNGHAHAGLSAFNWFCSLLYCVSTTHYKCSLSSTSKGEFEIKTKSINLVSSLFKEYLQAWQWRIATAESLISIMIRYLIYTLFTCRGIDSVMRLK